MFKKTGFFLKYFIQYFMSDIIILPLLICMLLHYNVGTLVLQNKQLFIGLFCFVCGCGYVVNYVAGV